MINQNKCKNCKKKCVLDFDIDFDIVVKQHILCGFSQGYLCMLIYTVQNNITINSFYLYALFHSNSRKFIYFNFKSDMVISFFSLSVCVDILLFLQNYCWFFRLSLSIAWLTNMNDFSLDMFCITSLCCTTEYLTILKILWRCHLVRIVYISDLNHI